MEGGKLERYSYYFELQSVEKKIHLLDSDWGPAPSSPFCHLNFFVSFIRYFIWYQNKETISEEDEKQTELKTEELPGQRCPPASFVQSISQESAKKN